MTEQKGICTNFTNCELADKQEVILIQKGDDFICPECQKPLMGIDPKRQFRPLMKIIGAAAVILLIAGIGYYLIPEEMPTQTPTPSPEPVTIIPKPAPVPTPAPVPKIPPSQITDMLEQGNYAEAKEAAASSGDPEVQKLLKIMNTPVRITVKNFKFQFQKENRPESPAYSLDSEQIQNLSLSHKDNYRLSVHIPSDSAELWLYIFQKDHFNMLHRIFPNPMICKTDNPIRADQNIRIPENENDMLYLDELPSGETSPIPETFHILVTPWKAEDIQTLYGSIHIETDSAKRDERIKEFLERLRQRDESNLPSVFYTTFTLTHE